jgi:hypothetical protein
LTKGDTRLTNTVDSATSSISLRYKLIR